MKNKLTMLLNKYDSLSAPVKASLWFTFSNVLQKGISLLTTPIFTRILTQEQYGLYSQYHSWLAIVTIFVTFNLYLGNYGKGLITYEKDRDAFCSSLVSLTTLITLIWAGIYLLSIDFWSNLFGLSPYLIGMMFLEIMALSAFEFWVIKERYEYKYKSVVLMSVLMTFFSLVFGVLAILFVSNYKVEARVFTDVAVKLVIGLYFMFFLIRKGKRIYDKKYWVYALKFNIPLIPHFLSNLVLNQSDRLMIGKMIGSAEVAKYSVAYTISMMMLLITNAVNNAYVPYTYKSIKSENYAALRKSTNFLILFVAFLCIVTMCFAPEIIYIFADSAYYDAIYIVPPVASSVFFIFLYSLFSNIEYYFQKTKYISTATFFGATLNVILNFIFIPKYGYYAAGYTTLICYVGLALSHYYFYRKVLQTEIENKQIYDLKSIAVVSLLLTAVMIVMALLYSTILLRYGFILVILVICFIKRNLLISIIKSIFAK